jgi:tRNA1(Val) A37 N6-methylase TrmN6
VSSPGPSSGRPADPPGSLSDAGTAVTEDRLLGGRVCLRQPAEGARAAIDPVFLAAAIPAAPHQQILDAGCGVGAAMLCLAARVPQCRVVGIELQRDLVRLAGDNLLLNGGADRLSVMVGDLLQPPPRLSPGSFDHVMANPPFIERGRGSPVSDPAKAAATIEGDAALGDWVRFALGMVRAKGSVTFIHRADRIDVLLAQLAGRAGAIVIFPLWPRAGQAANRVLVQARKQVAAPARLAAGLVLHEADGRFTAAADAILRGGEALVL